MSLSSMLFLSSFIIFNLSKFPVETLLSMGEKKPAVPTIDTTKDSLRFVGDHSVVDHFKLLQLDGTHLLIGARNVVYNISMHDFSVLPSIEWSASEKDVSECLMKGKPKDACHNYVRILAKGNDGSVLVCGTNAYDPKCRQYTSDKFGYFVQGIEFSGRGLSPYYPTHNSTFVRDGDYLYAATVSDFAGSDPLLHRRNVSRVKDLGIRTDRNDVHILNDPQFVGSFRDDDRVYVWFNEKAVEHDECCGGTGGGAVYSRVGRLCTGDRGGPGGYKHEFSSFVKTRLNCSIPGDYPFYFDRIEAVSDPILGDHSFDRSVDNVHLIYAVFTSPLSGVDSSAICAFDLSQIDAIFSNSAFTTRSSFVSNEIEPTVRPGVCTGQSAEIPSENTAAFARSHPLMNTAIDDFFGRAFVVNGETFTKIVVDPLVSLLNGRKFDVLFVGTDRGTVLKLVNTLDAMIHVHTLQVLEHQSAIRNMLLYRNSRSQSHLVVIGDREVRRIDLENCHRVHTCSQCVHLRDPYCAWDSEAAVCTFTTSRKSGLIQDVPGGKSALLCPSESLNSLPIPVGALKFDGKNCSCSRPTAREYTTSIRDIQKDAGYFGNGINYSVRKPIELARLAPNVDSQFIPRTSLSIDVQHLSLALLIAVCTSLLFGFIFGYLCSCKKWCHTSKMKLKTKNVVVFETQKAQQIPITSPYCPSQMLRHSSKSSNLINAYEQLPKFHENHAESGSIYRENCDHQPPNSEKSVQNSFSISTLPRNYRFVKKIYL